MPKLQEAIRQARQAGYSDDEIKSFLDSRGLSTPKTTMPQEPEPMVPEWGTKHPNLYGMYGAGKEMYGQIIQPALEGVGMGVGGILGAPAGPVGVYAGAGMGYDIAKKVGQAGFREIERLGGETPEYPTIAQEIGGSVANIATGATMEMGGQALGVAIPKTIAGIGKAASSVMGRLEGLGGATAVRQAFESGARTGLTKNPFASKTNFDKALRGELTGEEIVNMAKTSLNRIKDTRAIAYQSQLDKMTKTGKINQQIDIKPITDKFNSLMKQYNIAITKNKTGKDVIDVSRVAMGKKGIKDIKEIISKVRSWGKDPDDLTVKGLDILKRQLDDFYSDSSQARQFVTSLTDSVRKTIINEVPQYGRMTQDYAKATQLIKDLESGLNLRKQGMSGRIIPDKILRRLMSAMRDNYELRGELVNVLGYQGGEDITGAVAGHAMSSVVPRGLAGTGPAMVGNVALAYLVNPAFWPVVVASSPRISAEFLRMLGKFSTQFAGTGAAAGRAVAYSTLRRQE